MGTNCINLSLKQLQSEGEKVERTEEVTAAASVQRSKSATVLQTPQIEVSHLYSSVNGGGGMS